MDPGAYIATLEDGGRLEMQLTVRRGRGYASADDNKPEQTILGVIPIDSIFSPVRRVAYSVEPARVGQRTDFDKLTLEVETNGALDPRTAVGKAAAHAPGRAADLHRRRRGRRRRRPGARLAPANRRPPRAPSFDDTPIEELELGVRSYNCLKREGVETVGDLINKSEQELMCIPNFGRKSIEEVRERLEKNNLKLKGE